MVSCCDLYKERELDGVNTVAQEQILVDDLTQFDKILFLYKIMQVIYKICRVLNQYIHKSGKGIILFRFKFRFEHFDLRGGDKATAMQVTSDRFYQTLHKFVQIIIFL